MIQQDIQNELTQVAAMIARYSGNDNTDCLPEGGLQDILRGIEETLLKESTSIATNVCTLQEAARAADDHLQTNLQVQQEKLLLIDDKTSAVIREFDRALDGGLRIGERLATAEASRQQVQFAEDLMMYIKFFEDSPPQLPAKVLDCRSSDLLTFLPPKLATQSWMDISQVFQSLRRILYDINTSEMGDAEQVSFLFVQEVVIAISTAVEGLLLSLFEGQMMRCLERPDELRLIAETIEVVSALMTFNDGAALQKRYIFSVVAQRFVPADVSKKKDNGLGSKLLQGLGHTFMKAGAVVKRMSAQPTAEIGTGGDGDDSSSAGDEFDEVEGGSMGSQEEKPDRNTGISGLGGNDGDAGKISDMITFGRFGGPELRLADGLEEEEENQGVFGNFLSKTLAFSRKRANSGVGFGEDSSEIMDKMSRLFASLHALFTEQIVILRKVFPLVTAQKVIKMLLQRIFNDPAFGIQGRIDAVMRSGEQVSPSYYLDVLMIVREKLSAFFVMILECTNYIGRAGIEDAIKNKTNSASNITDSGNNQRMRMNAANDASNTVSHTETAVMLWNEEIRSFLEEQVCTMLQGYTKDYFHKELSFLNGQYSDILRAAGAEDPTIISKPIPGGDGNGGGVLSPTSVLGSGSNASSSLPRIRPEKVRSIGGLIGCVNSPLVHSILTVTSDAIARMGSIGRDDAALPVRAKDVFLTMIGFIVDNILIPAGKASKTLLNKHSTSRQFTAAPVSTDYLLLISCLHNSFFRIKSKFDSTFVPALQYENNELTVCREYHRKAMKSLDLISSECIHQWIEVSAMYNDRLLANLQSRYDFAPRFENKRNAGIQPTAACRQLCATLISTVGFVQNHISGENVKGGSGASNTDRHNLESIIWRELGQRLVASYLSHLRKSKISQEGAFVLVRDLDEYYSVIDTMHCPEVLDMFLSMREMSYVYMVPAENLEGMVSSELQHLDTHIMLCLLRARSDFSNRSAWVKQLNQLYPSFNKWDAPFAWEMSDSQLKEARVAEGLGGKHLAKKHGPPQTLRKVSMAKSALLVPASRTYGGPNGGIGGLGGANPPVGGKGVVSEGTGGQVKDGVYNMLKTAEQNATRVPAPAAVSIPVTSTPNKPPPSGTSTASKPPVGGQTQKSSERKAPIDANSGSNDNSGGKKPNMLERMASKMEVIVPGNNSSSNSSSKTGTGTEKKKNTIFGGFFGKGGS